MGTEQDFDKLSTLPSPRPPQVLPLDDRREIYSGEPVGLTHKITVVGPVSDFALPGAGRRVKQYPSRRAAPTRMYV